MLNTSPDLSGTDSNSVREQSPTSDGNDEVVSRRSFTSGRGSVFSAVSEESSMHSGRSGPSEVATGISTGSTLAESWKDTEGGRSAVEDGRAFADEISRVDQTEVCFHSSCLRHISGQT
jgi:hypothetical protein